MYMVSSQREQPEVLRDKLMGCLVGLARATDGNEHLISPSSTDVIVKSLSADCHDSSELEALLKRVEEEKRKMVPDCFRCASPCGKNSDYDMDRLWKAEEDVRSLKLLLIRGIRDLAVCASRAAAQGHYDQETERFFYKALIVIGMDDFSREDLLPFAQELRELNQSCAAVTAEGNLKVPSDI